MVITVKYEVRDARNGQSAYERLSALLISIYFHVREREVMVGQGFNPSCEPD